MGHWKKFTGILLIFVLLAGLLLRGNFCIQKDTVSLSLPRLPERFDGFRIAEIADLHGREFGPGNSRLLKATAEAAPDLIAIDGDLFDEKHSLSFLFTLLQGLLKIAPVFYVTGNHEWQLGRKLPRILSVMEKLGVHVLRNEYEILTRGKDRLAVAGVDDPCGPWDQKSPQALAEEIRRAEGENICILMLAHRNDQLAMWAALDMDLVLAGHAHGGILRLPVLGGVLGNDRQLFPDFDAGLYTEKRTFLYVSRGLGPDRFRLFNRPHLPILVLHSGNRKHFVNYSPKRL